MRIRRHVTLAVMTRTILMTNPSVKSLQLIWKPVTRRRIFFFIIALEMNMKSRIDCYRDHSEVRYSGNLQGPLVAELDKSTSPLFHHLILHQRKHQSPVLLALCVENPPVTGGFPTQRASNSECYSCHDVIVYRGSSCSLRRWRAPSSCPRVTSSPTWSCSHHRPGRQDSSYRSPSSESSSCSPGTTSCVDKNERWGFLTSLCWCPRIEISDIKLCI